MADHPDKINLDTFSTIALNDLLGKVMVKLRERDARDLSKNLVTKSQRVTLQQTLAQHQSEPQNR